MYSYIIQFLSVVSSTLTVQLYIKLNAYLKHEEREEFSLYGLLFKILKKNGILFL